MKGSYCLVVEVLRDEKIMIGKLGNMFFERGYYIYIGSALNNIEKRIFRHLKKEKKKFWHIDYLLGSGFVDVKEIYFKESFKKEECKIAREIAKKGLPVNGFGCSDCKCKSHLYKVDDFGFLEGFMEKVRPIKFLNLNNIAGVSESGQCNRLKEQDLRD